MPISPLFHQFVDDELARAPDLIARTVAATLDQLRQPRDGLLSSSERQHLFELQQALQTHAGRFQRAFVDHLRAAVKAEMDGQAGHATGASPRPSGLGGLQLMDETRVEADIEISRAIQAIDTVADWELRELQTFTSTLRGDEHVSAESNPLRPQVYARALWHAATEVPGLVPVQQAILLRLSATAIASQLKLAWAAASTRLEDQGVQPGIYRTVVYGSNTGRPLPQPEVDVTRPGALDGLLDAMPASTPPIPRPAGAPASSAARTRQDPGPALDEALRRIDMLLQHLPAAAGPAVAPAPRLTEHREALFASAEETVDRQIIELLSRLFDTLLADPLLLPGFRTVIARLQASVLRIALRDPSLLETHEHPVWQLMERMAEASTGAPADDARIVNLLHFCETLVADMQREPVQDAELYRHSLARLTSYLDQSLRRAQRDAQEAIDTLRLAEQIDDMQQQISARLVEQMVPIRTSAPIRRFVTGPWARVIAQAMLKFGDKSPEALAYIKAVDELLWSLQLPDHPQSRQRLITLLPGLLQRLREGMAFIELPPGEQQQLLDELMVVHTEALRPGSRTGSATPEAPLSPQDIVQRMRDEVVPGPGEHRSFSDSLIDLSSMDTVPAEWLPTTPQSPGDDPHDWVARMAPGRRYRLFLHGRWTQALLLWRSDRGQFFLFVSETGERHSVTARALQRLRGAQLVTTADEPLLIQRAVDGMLRGLAATRA